MFTPLFGTGQEGEGVGSTQLLETPCDLVSRGDSKGFRGSLASGVSSDTQRCITLHCAGWSPDVPSEFLFGDTL